MLVKHFNIKLLSNCCAGYGIETLDVELQCVDYYGIQQHLILGYKHPENMIRIVKNSLYIANKLSFVETQTLFWHRGYFLHCEYAHNRMTQSFHIF